MVETDLQLLLIGISALLVSAKILGEIAKFFQIPAIFGELCAGIIMGTTVLGKFLPETHNALYPTNGPIANFYSGFNAIAVLVILLIAGIEIKFRFLNAHKKNSVAVSLLGVIIPFISGFIFAYTHPELLGHMASDVSIINFALFFGTAMSITALPVIAKTYMDLNLLTHTVAVITISAAIIDDIIGWIIFGLVLTAANKSDFTYMNLLNICGAVTIYILIMVLIVKKFVNIAVKFIGERTDIGVSFCVLIMMLSAAATQLAGIHALFGAFFAGVLLGDSPHLSVNVRRQFENSVKGFFAPLFFSSLALHADFITNFELTILIYSFLIACGCKIIGCFIGAKISGMNVKDSFCVGIGMNSRGAMEIILGTLALQYGIIEEPLFIALVIIALLTSLMAGPILAKMLR